MGGVFVAGRRSASQWVLMEAGGQGTYCFVLQWTESVISPMASQPPGASIALLTSVPLQQEVSGPQRLCREG